MNPYETQGERQLKASVLIVRLEHPDWTDAQVCDEAISRFDARPELSVLTIWDKIRRNYPFSV